MAIELHHLHPSHDDEVARLKARIAELEKENQTLAEDVSDKIESITELMELVEKYKSEKAELKEERRWRKFSEEKPEGEGDYLVMARYPDDNEQHIEICFYDRNCEDFGHYERRYSGSGNSFGGFDGEEWVTHNVTYWLPMPSAPKEER